MKIVLEVNPLESPQKTGIATYIDQLVQALLAQSASDEIVLWAPDMAVKPYPQLPESRFWNNRLFSRTVLETLWRKTALFAVPGDVDVYHLLFPAYPAPRRRASTRYIVTIYDLAFAYYPESISERASFRTLAECIPAQAEQSNAITVISESCKRDLHTILAIPEEKIHVLYPGTDLAIPDAKQQAQAQPFLESVGLPEKYILCVGTWEYRKNLPTLFRALHLLRHKCREQHIRLCMTGIKGWNYAEAESLIARLELDDLIVTLGHVPRAVLPVLYQRALMFVYPSLYEGFGMPVLEAMACGTPVITTNVSSLPEVAGEAAIQVSPLDVEALAGAMEGFLDHPESRALWIDRGLVQAQKFSWDRTARQMLALYQSTPPLRS